MFPSTLVADLRAAARSLSRRRAHSLLVIVLMTLGIAGTTAIYSLVHSLLVAPLGIDAEDRLVYLDEKAPEWNLESTSIDPYDYLMWKGAASNFESISLFATREVNVVFGTDGDASGVRAEHLTGGRVTHDFFETVGVLPALGRVFTAEEDTRGAAKVVMIGHRLWVERFGGGEGSGDDAIGRTLRVDGEAHEIIGILPSDLPFPVDAQLLVPIGVAPERHGSYAYEGVGRLAPGVTPEQAADDLDRALAPAKEKYPYKQATSAVVTPLREHFVSGSRRVVETLMAATLLVLLVACANVASLMLAGGARRRREVGVRRALGADRWVIVRQLGVESLVLALAGALGGLALGRLALSAVGRFGVEGLPFWVDLSLDPKATLISVATCVGVLTVFGLLAAFVTSNVEPQESLRGDDPRAGGAPGRHRLLSGLVTVEMALAQILLVGAALVLLSQRQLLEVDHGFRVTDAGSFGIALSSATYPDSEDQYAFFDRLHRRLEEIGGHETALIDLPPLGGHSGGFFEVEGGIERPEDAPRPVVLVRWATADYFETLDVPLLTGRPFREPGLLEMPELESNGTPKDPTASVPAYEVVINQAFARTFFGDIDPVGRRIRSGGAWLTVSGVSRDVRHYGLDQEMRPGVYLPLGAPVWGRAPDQMAVVMTARDGVPFDWGASVGAARAVLAEIDPELPVYRVATFGESLRESMSLRSLTSWLFGVFAAVAMVLAAFGTFAVLSFVVGERRREIGVRVALGAGRARILRQVLARGLAMASLGALLGLGGAFAAGGLLSSLLYGVEARDLSVFLWVATLLLGIAALANAIPAWRASRLDPMQVLRDQ